MTMRDAAVAAAMLAATMLTGDPGLPNTPGRTFGVHYGMPEVASLFDTGKAAFVANVGTLIEPVQNRAQVAQNLKRLPLGLYSHSDQIEQWQTSVRMHAAESAGAAAWSI